MLFKKFQQLAQWVGFLAIAGLALYGFLSLGSGRLWAAGEESRPAAEDAPTITIPSTFNYQGFLRDGQGNPMGGTHKITLKLWKDVEATNVAALHTEDFPAVAVRDGLFNVLMGSLASLDTNIFVNNAAIFVGISVDDGAELLPRQRIHPVPWAILATSAQNATTAGTLQSGAAVQNLTHIGPLTFNDSKHKIDTFTHNDANGAVMRFFGPKGFSWVGADKNVYLMHLNDTTGLAVFNGLNVYGGVSVAGAKPVIIKQFTDQPHGTWVNTGIPISTYNCTMGSWIIRMDIDENVTGDWFRYVRMNTTTGNWEAMLRSVVHSSTPTKVWFDVVCFHNDISQWSQQSAVSAASNSDSSSLQADVTSDETGQ